MTRTGRLYAGFRSVGLGRRFGVPPLGQAGLGVGFLSGGGGVLHSDRPAFVSAFYPGVVGPVLTRTGRLYAGFRSVGLAGGPDRLVSYFDTSFLSEGLRLQVVRTGWSLILRPAFDPWAAGPGPDRPLWRLSIRGPGLWPPLGQVGA